MPTFLTPDILLALAKITALLLIILALAPLLKNPTHRARLWTGTILALPIVFFTSFSTPLLELIPLKKTATPLTALLENNGQRVTQNGLGETLRYRSATSDHDFDLSAIEPDSEPIDLAEYRELDLPTAPASNSQPAPIDPPLKTQNSPPIHNDSWIFLIAIPGTLLALLPMLVSIFKILRLTKSNAQNPPLALWTKIHRHSRKTPLLLFTPSPAAPFACGLIKPRVILPDDSPTWPLRRIKSTLLHEAEHLRRRDPLARFLSTLIRAILWFHPLVWLAHRQLIAAQEQACDQAALSHGIAPVDYAEELLGSVSHSHLTPSQALSMAKWSQLGNRVRHVLEKPKPTKMKTVILTSGLSLITILILTSIGFSQESAKETPSVKTPALPSPVIPKTGRGAILDRNDQPIAINDQDGNRTYPFGESLGHVSGFVDQPDRKKPKLITGVSGLEQSYNGTLAQSLDVKVTLDGEIQKYCYGLLAKQDFPGSIIVQNPNSGEIISMVSYPSFHPRIFLSPGFAVIFEDPTVTLNRSITPQTPGSMSKLFAALAGEHAGLNNPEIHCKGFLSIGTIKIRDWKTNRDELFHIPGALEQSCNTYFMELAIRTGEDSFNRMGQLLHFNESPLAELPGPKSRYQAWPVGRTSTRASLALTAIGQGLVSLTPLHVNSLTSAIASGSWHQPHLTLGENKTKPSVPLIGQGEITADSLKVIRQGMHLTIHGERGTAKRAAVPGLQLAGKTGTAQLSKAKAPTHNSWFTGYGPYETPKYSVTVMLSGADSGGRFAAPIAAEVFKKLLIKDE